ncbi:expressed unknown protein [Seminavis robusta]|uniref:Uncharacterized protein n=1 Tax=Seminavis robusta TaxID=568900 RepID=A0A9N8DI37_9STRA|nr:expressed unknown protein [Seminavis robusta]|eukprot:Sro169_g075260.1 n/a (365) ;mRNA; f:92599-93693
MNSSSGSRSRVQLGIQQADVEALASAISKDNAMHVPMVPDAVEKVVYQSAIKLTFNLFYKGISGLDGLGLVPSSSSNGRELHLDRMHLDRGGQGSMSEVQYRQWKSFATKLDLVPLERLASALIDNEAVNLTVVPDNIEKEIYFNCLKIIFWVIDIMSSNIKVTLCGHTISMNFAPATSSYLGSRGGNGAAVSQLVSQINAFMVNPQTIKDFQNQAKALLQMDGKSPGSKKGNGSNSVKSGLAWMKSSLNKIQQEMIQQLNVSLYGLILAIVDDLLKSTKIEILNDEISLRVASAGGGKNHGARKDNNLRSSNLNGTGVDDVALAVEASLASLEFDQERALLQRRFQQWSPEERAQMLRDLGQI